MNTRQKGMSLLTGLKYSAVFLLLAACVAAPKTTVHPAAPQVEVDAGALVLFVDGKREVILFVSMTGEYAELGYDECSKKAECRMRFNALVAAGKVEGIELFSETSHT